MRAKYRAAYSTLPDEEKILYEKMARDHNQRQGHIKEACVEALQANSQRSYDYLAKVSCWKYLNQTFMYYSF
jgi:hypothetical protein